MKGSYEILRKALALYVDRDNYCYFYGAKNIVLTDAVMLRLIREEPDYWKRYTDGQIKRIMDFSRGKIGLDCSAFVGLCVGKMEWSGALIEDCVKYTSPKNGKAGCVLYKPGHVQLDLGYGYTIGIQKEMETIRIDKIDSIGFTKSGEFKGYDYTEAVNY